MTIPADWPTGDLESRVRFAIEEVRPALQADGGDVGLIRIDGGVVYVELRGACDGCPMAKSTLADFVTDRICLYAPEIETVTTVNF
jgi:Fe-S cluster biogenesis protein NfuA